MDDHYYLPPEWYRQDGIQLTWPHAGTDWKDCLDEITATFLTLADAITRYESLLIVVPDTEGLLRLLRQHLSAEALRRITLFSCPTNDTWARDHGAITLLDRQNPHASPLLLDFHFNGWGEKFPSQLDNAINRHLSASGMLGGKLQSHDDFVLEGGAIESDGQGTIFTTSTCLLAPHRNQPLDRDGLEEQLRLRLHANRIVWIDHGTLTGDDTDGHIDTIVRCAPADTLLYVTCDDPADEQYADFAALSAQLHQLRTTAGQPYRLLPLPMPDAICEAGERLPATYANFLIINGAVLVPTYAQAEKDQQALTTIAEAFPDRDIIGIDARTIIRQHGSIHCLTMQYPEGALRLTTSDNPPSHHIQQA